jgi:hypothetical protein
MDPYTAYYLRQAQTGYSGSQYKQQSGRGLGRFLMSIIRTVTPFMKSGFKAIGNELLSAGAGILTDTVKQVPTRESFRNRVREFGNNLTERAVNKVSGMSGGGRGVYKRKATTQLHSSCKRRKSNKVKQLGRPKKRSTDSRKKKTKRLQVKKKRLSKNKAKRVAKKKKKKRSGSVKTNKFLDIFK